MTRRIDARGLLCPWPALKLARAMREADDPVGIIADDPAAPREIASLAAAHGWRCEQDGAYFLLHKPSA